jgi:hypothetical protein
VYSFLLVVTIRLFSKSTHVTLRGRQVIVFLPTARRKRFHWDGTGKSCGSECAATDPVCLRWSRSANPHPCRWGESLFNIKCKIHGINGKKVIVNFGFSAALRQQLFMLLKVDSRGGGGEQEIIRVEGF